MANGQQLAKKNVIAFTAWLESKTDDDFRQLVSRGVLSRKEIAIECGFSKSALDQNPEIKAALAKAELDLRRRGILPRATDEVADPVSKPLVRETSGQKDRHDAERLRRLENENASLRGENGELKRQLARHAIIREALALTGRVPR